MHSKSRRVFTMLAGICLGYLVLVDYAVLPRWSMTFEVIVLVTLFAAIIVLISDLMNRFDSH